MCFNFKFFNRFHIFNLNWFFFFNEFLFWNFESHQSKLQGIHYSVLHQMQSLQFSAKHYHDKPIDLIVPNWTQTGSFTTEMKPNGQPSKLIYSTHQESTLLANLSYNVCLLLFCILFIFSNCSRYLHELRCFVFVLCLCLHCCFEMCAIVASHSFELIFLTLTIKPSK